MAMTIADLHDATQSYVSYRPAHGPGWAGKSMLIPSNCPAPAQSSGCRFGAVELTFGTGQPPDCVQIDAKAPALNLVRAVSKAPNCRTPVQAANAMSLDRHPEPVALFGLRAGIAIHKSDVLFYRTS